MKHSEIITGIKVTAKTKYDYINAIVLGFKPGSRTKVNLEEIGEDKPKKFKHGWQRGTFVAGDLYTIHIDDIYPIENFVRPTTTFRTFEENEAIKKAGPNTNSQHNLESTKCPHPSEYRWKDEDGKVFCGLCNKYF